MNKNKHNIEIIFNDELIFNPDTYFELKKGDIFYFSVSDYTPKRKQLHIENCESNMGGKLKPEFWDSFFETITKKSDKFHIIQFKVIEVKKSVSENYMMGYNEFYTSYTVIEYYTIREKFVILKNKICNFFTKFL